MKLHWTRTPALAALALLCGTLWFGGCSGPKEAASEEDEFFVPVDTAATKPEARGANAIDPVSVDLQEGAKLASTTDEFGAPLTNENVLIREHLSPEAMRDSLDLISEQISYLQNILEASTIDPRMYYHSQVKSWTINNPALRDSLFYALLAVDSSMESEAGTDAQVLATETNDLIEVRFGTSVFKGLTLKQALEKSSDRFLQRKLVESGGYSRDIELRDTNFSIPTPLHPELLSQAQLVEKFVDNGSLRNGRASLSLYDASVRLGPNWGAEIKAGNDEIGLPFWSSGNAALFATYKQIKVGFQVPWNVAWNSGDNFPLFNVRNRLFNGTRGIAAEADFGILGGSFFSSHLNASDVIAGNSKKDIYFIPNELVGYYSFAFSLNNANFIRTKLGGGYHQVKTAQLIAPENNLNEVASTTVASYYIDFDFLHEIARERFGAHLQLYNLTLLSSAWLDIIPNVFQIELKYLKIIARDTREWENPDFIIVSPKITYSF